MCQNSLGKKRKENWPPPAQQGSHRGYKFLCKKVIFFFGPYFCFLKLRQKWKKVFAEEKNSKWWKTRHVNSGGTSGAIVSHSKNDIFFWKFTSRKKKLHFFLKIYKSLRSGNTEKTPEIPGGEKKCKKVHKNFPEICKFAKFGVFLTKIQ